MYGIGNFDGDDRLHHDNLLPEPTNPLAFTPAKEYNGFMYGDPAAHRRDKDVGIEQHRKEAPVPKVVVDPTGATIAIKNLREAANKRPFIRLLKYVTKNPKDRSISFVEEACGAVVAGAGYTTVALAINGGHLALVVLAKHLGFSPSASAHFWFLSPDEIKEKTRNVAVITLAMELGINSAINLLSSKVANTVKSIKVKSKFHKANESVEIADPIDAMKVTGAAAALQAYHKEVGHPSLPVAEPVEEHDHAHKVAHPPLGGAAPALHANHEDKEHGHESHGHRHESHGHGGHGHGHEEEGNWLIPFLQEARKGSLMRPAQRFLRYYKTKTTHAAVVGVAALVLSEGVNLIQWPFSGHFSYYNDAAIARNMMAATTIDILIEMGGHKLAHPIMHMAGEQSRRVVDAVTDVSKKTMHIAGEHRQRAKTAVSAILENPERDLKAAEWEHRRDTMARTPGLLSTAEMPKLQSDLKQEPTIQAIPRARVVHVPHQYLN